MKVKPNCRKCERPHWPFVRCENVEAWEASATPEPSPTRPVQVAWHSGQDRSFTNRVTSVDVTSTPGVTWRVRSGD